MSHENRFFKSNIAQFKGYILCIATKLHSDNLTRCFYSSIIDMYEKIVEID